MKFTWRKIYGGNGERVTLHNTRVNHFDKSPEEMFDKKKLARIHNAIHYTHEHMREEAAMRQGKSGVEVGSLSL
jgi:hypothetical protein